MLLASPHFSTTTSNKRQQTIKQWQTISQGNTEKSIDLRIGWIEDQSSFLHISKQLCMKTELNQFAYDDSSTFVSKPITAHMLLVISCNQDFRVNFGSFSVVQMFARTMAAYLMQWVKVCQGPDMSPWEIHRPHQLKLPDLIPFAKHCSLFRICKLLFTKTIYTVCYIVHGAGRKSTSLPPCPRAETLLIHVTSADYDLQSESRKLID